MDCNRRPSFTSPTPPTVVEFNRFGILADVLGRIADRAVDVLMALIEASGR